MKKSNEVKFDVHAMRNSAMDRAASKTTGIMPNSPMSKATNMGGLLRRTAAILAAVVMSVAATPAVDVTAANEPNTLAATTASGNNTTIVLTIGSTTYTVNGVPSTSTSAPVIIGGSTMTPARLVAEALGASVDWDGNTQRVTIVGHNAQGQPLTVVLTIGSTTYTVGGIAHQASAAPVIVGGSTMTPARLVAELLGASVDWDGNTQRVTITRSQAEQVATVPPATTAPPATTPPTGVAVQPVITTPEDMRSSVVNDGRWPGTHWVEGAYPFIRPGSNIRRADAVEAERLAFEANNANRPQAEIEFESAAYEWLKNFQIANGNIVPVLDENLSGAARWRSANNDLFADMRTTDLSTLIIRIPPNNLSLEPVITEVNRRFRTPASQIFTGTPDEIAQRNGQGSRPGLVGIGYSSDSGLLTITFVSTAIYHTTEYIGHNIEGISSIGGWFMDSPYFIELNREHSPFFLPYLVSLGHTEEEIMNLREQEIFRLTNEMRVAAKVSPVLWDDSLGRSARTTAQTPGMFNHVAPDGSTATDRARRAGWQGDTVLENASGPAGSPMSNIGGWMISLGHRANLLSSRHTHLGTGYGSTRDGGLFEIAELSHWRVDLFTSEHPGLSTVQQFSRQ